jgi:S-adenosylmethionine synthetase
MAERSPRGGFPAGCARDHQDIGYDNTDYGIDYRMAVLVAYDKQSPDIAQGVDGVVGPSRAGDQD